MGVSGQPISPILKVQEAQKTGLYTTSTFSTFLKKSFLSTFYVPLNKPEFYQVIPNLHLLLAP